MQGSVVEEAFDDLAQVEVTSHVKKFPVHGAVLDSVIGSDEVYAPVMSLHSKLSSMCWVRFNSCPAHERPGRKPA